ncbi:RNA-binding protein 34-like [Diaphorina citri]|uniref:RNA-binding protein 34-like n=1 Tax=Diaphorina citri TaxID=121845 RepID=A0A3Q0IJ89_DIACI|nr:RNA-binding protein 34-like [Diaphorina citri]
MSQGPLAYMKIIKHTQYTLYHKQVLRQIVFNFSYIIISWMFDSNPVENGSPVKNEKVKKRKLNDTSTEETVKVKKKAKTVPKKGSTKEDQENVSVDIEKGAKISKKKKAKLNKGLEKSKLKSSKKVVVSKDAEKETNIISEKTKNSSKVQAKPEPVENKTEPQESKKKNKKQLKKGLLDNSNKLNAEQTTSSELSAKVNENKKSITKKGKKTVTGDVDNKELPKSDNDTNTEQKSDEQAKGFPKHLENGSETKDEPKFNEEQESRTIFVGNLPLKINRDRVTSMFKPYGEVETVRFRSVPVADITLPRKACIKMNKVHEKRTNMNAYVRFKNLESVEKALEMNGHVIDEHTIRVDKALTTTKSNSHSIFIGNIPFEAEEEELRKAFESCGEIDNVRLIRDQHTNIGKGFGYVNFKSADGVAFALELENVKIRNREVRVKRSFDKNTTNSSGRFNNQKSVSGGGFPKFNKSDRSSAGFKGKQNGAERRLEGKRDFGAQKSPGGFRRHDGAVMNSEYQIGAVADIISRLWQNQHSTGIGTYLVISCLFLNGGGGFSQRNVGGGFNPKNDKSGFKSRDGNRFNNRENGGRFNKKEGSGGGFRKNMDNKNSFRGSTVEDKSNKNNQKKKKLSYDALKKFIIAKKLTGGAEKKKGFKFLST